MRTRRANISGDQVRLMRLMEEKGWMRIEIARHLGINPSIVTRHLRPIPSRKKISLDVPEPPNSPEDNEPCALYRHFDKNGVLLYVGISIAHLGRLRGHKSKSTWFDEIANVTIEWLPSRHLAEMAETLAIAKEKPLHNKAKRIYPQPFTIAGKLPPFTTRPTSPKLMHGDAALFFPSGKVLDVRGDEDEPSKFEWH